MSVTKALRPCPTGKRRYHDRLGALIALANVAARDRDERRCYRCPLCRGWHLTSQAKERTA